jgi:hypothetical protein
MLTPSIDFSISRPSPIKEMRISPDRRRADPFIGRYSWAKGVRRERRQRLAIFYEASIFFSEIVLMLRTTYAAAVILAVTSMNAALAGQDAGQPEPTLSPAETAAVTRQIATLHSSVDRSVANGWSNAKKVAELICRPAALPVLKKQLPGTDRVFLGTDDPKTLNLESNTKLTGTGSARTPKGWQDFTFTCEVDPETGKVTGFTAALVPSAK